MDYTDEWAKPDRNLAARHWVAAAFIAMVPIGIFLVSTEKVKFLQYAHRERLVELQNPVGENIVSFCLAALRVHSQVVGTSVRITDEDRGRELGSYYTYYQVPCQWGILLLGSVIAAICWPMSWVRRAALLASNLLISPIVLLAGYSLAESLQNGLDPRGRSAQVQIAAMAAEAIAMSLCVMAWLPMLRGRQAIADKTGHLNRDPWRNAPELMGVAIGISVLLIWCLVTNGVGGEISARVALFCCFGAIGVIMLWLCIGGQRWARVWAIAPLALCSGWLFLIAALVTRTTHARAMCDEPIDAETRDQLNRRSQRPLTPIVWVMLIIAVLGAADQLFRCFARRPLVWIGYVPESLSSWFTVGLTATAAALAFWEWRSLRGRSGLALARRGMLVAGLALLFLAAAGSFAGFGDHVRTQEYRRWVAEFPVWPQHVRVTGQRMVSFPVQIGPFVLSDESETDASAQASTSQADPPLTMSRQGAWFFRRRCQDSRAPGTPPHRLAVYYVPLTSGFNDVLLYNPTSIRLGIASAPGGDIPCDREQQGSSCIYQFKIVDGRFISPANYHQSVPRAGYVSHVQFQIILPEGQADRLDQAATEFLTHMLPHILQSLPSEEDVRRGRPSWL